MAFESDYSKVYELGGFIVYVCEATGIRICILGRVMHVFISKVYSKGASKTDNITEHNVQQKETQIATYPYTKYLISRKLQNIPIKKIKQSVSRKSDNIPMFSVPAKLKTFNPLYSDSLYFAASICCRKLR